MIMPATAPTCSSWPNHGTDSPGSMTKTATPVHNPGPQTPQVAIRAQPRPRSVSTASDTTSAATTINPAAVATSSGPDVLPRERKSEMATSTAIAAANNSAAMPANT